MELCINLIISKSTEWTFLSQKLIPVENMYDISVSF